MLLGYVVCEFFSNCRKSLKIFSNVLTEKNSCVSGPMQFKLVLFKGQLQCNAVVFVGFPGTRIHGFVSCLLLFSCVTLGKLRNLSMPVSKMGLVMYMFLNSDSNVPV